MPDSTKPLVMLVVLLAGPDRAYLGFVAHQRAFDDATLRAVLDDHERDYRPRSDPGAAGSAGLGPVPAVPAGLTSSPRYHFTVGKTDVARLQAVAEECGTTWFTLLATAIAVTAWQTGGADDIVIYVPAGLHGPDEQGQVGYLPLRIRVGGAGVRLADLVAQARWGVAAAARRGLQADDMPVPPPGSGESDDLGESQVTPELFPCGNDVPALECLGGNLLDQAGYDPDSDLCLIVSDAKADPQPGAGSLEDCVYRFGAVLASILETMAKDPAAVVGAAPADALFSESSALVSSGGSADAGHQAAVTARHVATAFAEVLRLAEVPGADDDFFQLGGQSLQAVRVAAQISEFSGRKVTIREIFDHPTPAELGRHLASEAGVTGGAK